MINHLPYPHPLDFDWRYNEDTARRLSCMLAPYDTVLCLGTPSVARLLDAHNRDVTLVDRQPFQNVRQHITLDIGEFQPVRAYDVALLDPPWYPETVRLWTTVAARCVGAGGKVFVSIWPPTTRPGAEREVELLLNEFESWGKVERMVFPLQYDIPRFEIVAAALNNNELSRSPRLGELVRIDVRELPPQPAIFTTSRDWIRFVFNEYQIAVKSSAPDGKAVICPVVGATGWEWPYVSARAPNREEIDLWSSEGEVAKISGPEKIAHYLRLAGQTSNREEFYQVLGKLPELRNWRIPPPPYRRFAEW